MEKCSDKIYQLQAIIRFLQAITALTASCCDNIYYGIEFANLCAPSLVHPEVP